MYVTDHAVAGPAASLSLIAVTKVIFNPVKSKYRLMDSETDASEYAAIRRPGHSKTPYAASTRFQRAIEGVGRLKPIASRGRISYNVADMNSMQANSGRGNLVSFKLAGRWSGRGVLCDVKGRRFSQGEWAACLADPEMLPQNAEKILKDDGPGWVGVTNLAVAGHRLRVVVKRHNPAPGFRIFFRSLRCGRGLRNLRTALRLVKLDIPVALPLAALQQRCGPFVTQSIYITEYIDNSDHLYNLAVKQLSQAPAEKPALRKQLCPQVAAILAGLHNNGLWHRDAKATNFLVSRTTGGEYKVRLVDMDGIKRYFVRRKCRRLRPLWQLAASLMSVDGVNRTDYLRVFNFYCNLTGVDTSKRRGLFDELAVLARADLKRRSAKAAVKSRYSN